jgi:hypothetical protein
LLVGSLAEDGDGRGARPEGEELLQRRRILANVLLDDVDTLGKKELLLTVAGRSATLREQRYLLSHDSLRLGSYSTTTCSIPLR